MGKYKNYISPRRHTVATPKKLVKKGKAVFGTFDKEFESMDLESCVKPIHRFFPQVFNRFRLTLWQACEVHLDNGVLLAAVSDMGLFGIILHVFFDKRSRKVSSWKSILRRSEMTIAPNLLAGNTSEAETKNSFIRFVNHFESGYCRVEGGHSDKERTLEYAFELERVSLPCVVSIPFGPNRPLYTQKDLFRAQGSLKIDDETFTSSDQSTAVVDDHKGYYPYNAHYDWLSTMGRRGEEYFGINLTRNQSIDQEKYNENMIWLDKAISPLPPVNFQRNEDGTVWQVQDRHDMVRVKFKRADQFHLDINAGLIKVDYAIAFGELSGYVRDLEGKSYVLDGMMGIGEDKTLRF